MVVDDSRIAQLQIEEILSDSDYQVVACCKSGEEAIEMYDTVKPDIVTMDILMPGMDGLDTARLIMSANPDAKIIMVSSLEYDDAIKEANNIGAKGFVYKPFDRDMIMSAFKNAFSQ